MADMVVFPFIVLSIRQVYPLHYRCKAVRCLCRLKYKMNVICHQDVMVKLKFVSFFVPREQLHILFKVFVSLKNILAIVSPC